MIRPKRRSPQSKVDVDTGAFSDGVRAASKQTSPRRSSLAIPNGTARNTGLTRSNSQDSYSQGANGSARSYHAKRKSRKRKRSRWLAQRRSFQIGIAVAGMFTLSFGVAFFGSRYAMDTSTELPAVLVERPQHEFQHRLSEAAKCSPLHPDDVTFTVVTQFSEDRMWMMEHHCHRWSGTFSVAVLTDRSQQEIANELASFCHTDHMSIQVLKGYPEDDYPVNVLRNMALRAVHSTHVVYVDIDFWESYDLFDTLQLHRKALSENKRLALLMPAFQLNRQCREWKDCREQNIPVMPGTKEELLDLFHARQAAPFDPTNQGGHGSTRYMDWLDQDASTLLPIECFKSNRFEPYLVFRICDELPPFQEAFSGYGKNKMTWVMQLRRSGWTFLQIGDSFLVHYPHLDSKSRMKWNGGPQGEQLRRPKEAESVDWLAFKRGQIDQTFLDFRSWLETNVKDETIVFKCPDAMNDDEKLWTNKLPPTNS